MGFRATLGFGLYGPGFQPPARQTKQDEALHRELRFKDPPHRFNFHEYIVKAGDLGTKRGWAVLGATTLGFRASRLVACLPQGANPKVAV